MQTAGSHPVLGLSAHAFLSTLPRPLGEGTSVYPAHGDSLLLALLASFLSYLLLSPDPGLGEQ